MILGVGAQKAGTSWLFDHLASYPEVAASPLKELHFFNAWLSPRFCGGYDRRFREALARASRPLPRLLAPARRRALAERVAMIDDRAEYLRFFARRAGDRRFLLEISPCYSMLGPRKFAVVRRYFEAAGVTVRPVFLMRDPVERHWSNLRMRERDAGGGFDARAAFLRSLDRPGEIRRGRYDFTLRALRRAFGETAVTVGFYEHVFADPETGLRPLVEGLGLVWRPADAARRVNASPRSAALSEAEIAAARARFRPVYDFVRGEFGGGTPAAWRG